MARKGKKNEQKAETRPRDGSVQADPAPRGGDPDGQEHQDDVREDIRPVEGAAVAEDAGGAGGDATGGSEALDEELVDQVAGDLALAFALHEKLIGIEEHRKLASTILANISKRIPAVAAKSKPEGELPDSVFVELPPGARAMHAAEAAAMAVTAGLGFPCRFDPEIYTILDISPDIPAEALLQFMTSDVYPFRADAAEALKAAYVGLAPWVKAENARLAEEAAARPPGKSRYEKEGRVGKVGEKVLDAEELARQQRATGGVAIGEAS
jgi:hypothetical protein